MEKHGIEADTPSQERPPCWNISGCGYWQWSHHDGESQNNVLEHRLLAVAEYGFDAVCGSVVHHVNHMKMDNRIENVDIMSNSEHMKYHSNHPGFAHLPEHQE